MGRDGKEKGELGSAHQLFSAQKLNWGRGEEGKGEGRGAPPPKGRPGSASGAARFSCSVLGRCGISASFRPVGRPSVVSNSSG